MAVNSRGLTGSLFRNTLRQARRGCFYCTSVDPGGPRRRGKVISPGEALGGDERGNWKGDPMYGLEDQTLRRSGIIAVALLALLVTGRPTAAGPGDYFPP